MKKTLGLMAATLAVTGGTTMAEEFSVVGSWVNQHFSDTFDGNITIQTAISSSHIWMLTISESNHKLITKWSLYSGDVPTSNLDERGRYLRYHRRYSAKQIS